MNDPGWQSTGAQTPSVATTRVSVPDVVDVIHRPELSGKLTATGATPVTLVTALPGAGKTTAVASWASRRSQPVAWLTCSIEDRDVSTLWQALLQAVERAVSHDSHAPLARELTDPAKLANFLSDLDDTLTIVIDDAHVPGKALRSLDPLIEWLPRQVRIIVIARGPTALVTARLALRGKLATIHDHELRCTTAETVELLERSGLRATVDMVSQVQRTTGGWISSIVLTAAELNNAAGADVPRVPSAIEAFVRTELLADVDDELQKFLFDVCILDELSHEACAALCGLERTNTHLATLRNGTLPIGTLESATFRIHPQLAAVLQAMAAEIDPDFLSRRHVIAADAFNAAGECSRAVRHYVRAGELDRATSLVKQCIEASPYSAAFDAAMTWLDNIDPAYIREDSTGHSQVIAAICLILRGRLSSAQRMLDRIRSLDPEAAQAVKAGVATCRAAIALAEGDTEGVEAATADSPGDLPFLWTTFEALQLGRARMWAGDIGGARAAVAKLDSHPQLEGPNEASLLALHAELAVHEGRLREAIELADAARELVRFDDPAAACALQDVYRAFGMAYHERGDLVRAEADLLRSRDFSDSRPAAVAATLAYLARNHCALGSLDAAIAAITQARERLAGQAPLRDALLAIEVLIDLRIGDIDRARQGLDQVSDTRTRSHLELRHALVAQAPEAAAFISRLPAPVSFREQLEGCLLEAAVAQQAGEHSRAREKLLAALDLAEPEQFVQPFFGVGMRFGSALTGALRQRPRSQLSNALRLEHDRLQHLSRQTPAHDAAARMAQLTPREREILQLLNSNKTVRKLAEDAHLSPNTFRTHIKSLYRKLGVTSREDAVRTLTYS